MTDTDRGPAGTRSPAELERRLIHNRSFLALLATQFLGAANDNVLRYFITLQAASGLWRAASGGEGISGLIFTLFTLPFLAFSSFGGQFADRFSKQRVAVTMKGVEVGVMTLALIFIGHGSYGGSLVALVLMATQSAFFGPAKYGIIPEIVDTADLSRANGLINMTTNLAVIGGMLGGGWLSTVYTGADIVPGAVLVLVSLAGLLAATRIDPVAPHDPGLTVEWNLLKPLGRSLREMVRDRILGRVAFAWAFFYFLGVIVMAAVPDLGTMLLGPGPAHHARTTLLLVVLMVGIGVSSLAAGALSGGRIRLGLVAPGIYAVSVLMLGFAILPRSFGCALAGYLALGLATGFYVIPLQALLQERAGEDRRGRILGTTNFLSFLFMAVGGGIYYVLARGAGLAAPEILFLNGGLAFGVGTVFARWRRRGALPDGAAGA